MNGKSRTLSTLSRSGQSTAASTATIRLPSTTLHLPEAIAAEVNLEESAFIAVSSPRSVPAILRIRTLGTFTANLPGDSIFVTSQRGVAFARLLLTSLVAAPGYRCSREQLMDQLWPDLDALQAREALRHALSQLRRLLEPERAAYSTSRYIGSDREAVWLNITAPGADRQSVVWVDHYHFERLAQAALTTWTQIADPATTAPVRDVSESSTYPLVLAEKAISLYRGPFLPMHTHLEWTHAVRARCQRVWVTLVRRLADHAARSHAFDHAELLLGQLVDIAPDDEDAAAQLMCVQAAAGHRGEALRTYELLRLTLATQLQTVPTREMQELAEAIRSSRSQQDLLGFVTRAR